MPLLAVPLSANFFKGSKKEKRAAKTPWCGGLGCSLVQAVVSAALTDNLQLHR